MPRQNVHLTAQDENGVTAFNGWSRGLPSLNLVLAGARPGPFTIFCSFEGTEEDGKAEIAKLPRSLTLINRTTTD